MHRLRVSLLCEARCFVKGRSSTWLLKGLRSLQSFSEEAPPHEEARAGQFHSAGDTATNAGRFMPGDWLCPSCNFRNFAKRTECKACGVQKSKLAAQQPLPDGWREAQADNGMSYYWRESDPERSTTWTRPASTAAPAVILEAFNKSSKPGDWLCSSCFAHNFRSREVCKDCNNSRTPISPDGAE
mmetsp:Transcript_52211/g.93664  ORF Transcript_52211/g.93664 Transcript_52211/m.93664 type:complete len:185 (-) Transcript_52211:195-749(-)|eukprot:CAMPEP_0197632592 /NCGR_PEP_ID=MMETSP1338-20131121/9267_1 /TAXON_ID=43686 ORGANISM="Pelagodinium beii, Strain RCC1491" /NCGR_SAMPLE_ID=MMETSP1338 /ASSEMBLY_ACC=CAM_ASM_000754 /LENGTH=184 /DNA_ID=CAMNT_0043204155 /DNA_START=56 /DNA_END=610 /DNA_ORIENTATION=-